MILPLLLLPLHYNHDAKLDRDYARYSGDNDHFQLILHRRSAVRVLWSNGRLWELAQCYAVLTGSYVVTPVKSVHADFGMASAFFHLSILST